MNETVSRRIDAVVVEEQIEFTLADLSRACDAEPDRLQELVGAGVLEPAGHGPQDWRFRGPALRNARIALRLLRDLELEPQAAALVLDLLAENEALRSRLWRAGLR
jgi:chaperone modulatory protein CbpM